MCKKKKNTREHQKKITGDSLKNLIDKMEKQLSEEAIEKINEYYRIKNQEAVQYDFYYTSYGTGDANAKL